ncbi:MAG TPA: GNAT family N-acetyltransferase [Victivallales bacterium]|nr:GNAT family N-acetyltransferase [Victivallales bacterium]
MNIIIRDPKLPIIKTKRLTIRDIEVSDISDEYIAWLNNPEVNKFLEVRFSQQNRQTVENYIRSKLSDTKASKHFGVYDKGGKRLVGTVTLPSIKWKHLSSDISFVIGHPEAQGKGYATEAVHGVIYYCFKCCGLVKLWAGYYDGHEGSAKVLRKNGFREEGRIVKELIDFRGVRVDHVLVGLLAEDFIPDKSLLGDVE